MGRSGRGPSRRSHIKSRKGCRTCKRRHIRCDEKFPQCSNCTKHKVRCPYNDVLVAVKSEHSGASDKPDLQWTPQIEADIAEWLRTGILPFPAVVTCLAPLPERHSVDDLRLIYHLASIHHQLATIGANNFTLWTRHIPTLLRIAAAYPYVMDTILAFSATHIAFLTGCPSVGNMASNFRETAMRGLNDAIAYFSCETSEAVLAAAIVLSWLASDWHSWTQLTQLASTVIDAMGAWKHNSVLADSIVQQNTHAANSVSSAPKLRPNQLGRDFIATLQWALDQVQTFKYYFRRHDKDCFQIEALILYLEDTYRLKPQLDIPHQYERLQPLRIWLFYVPVDYLQRCGASSDSLVALVQIYTALLSFELLCSDTGATVFGSLSIIPREAITRRLVSFGAVATVQNTPSSLDLAHFAVSKATESSSCVGWVMPEPTRSSLEYSPLNVLGSIAPFSSAPETEPYANDTLELCHSAGVCTNEWIPTYVEEAD